MDSRLTETSPCTVQCIQLRLTHARTPENSPTQLETVVRLLRSGSELDVCIKSEEAARRLPAQSDGFPSSVISLRHRLHCTGEPENDGHKYNRCGTEKKENSCPRHLPAVALILKLELQIGHKILCKHRRALLVSPQVLLRTARHRRSAQPRGNWQVFLEFKDPDLRPPVECSDGSALERKGDTLTASSFFPAFNARPTPPPSRRILNHRARSGRLASRLARVKSK